jgi:hypothetical protein
VVVQRETDDAIEFDVTTGMVPGRMRFDKGHGHLIRFVVPAR